MRLSSSSHSSTRRSGMIHRRRGEMEEERRAVAAALVDVDRSAVRDRDLPHDREAESRAAYAAARFSTIERLEQARRFASVDTGSPVFDGDRHAPVVNIVT